MIEILKYTIPAIAVLLGVWIIQRAMYHNEEKKRQWELKRESQKQITPIRMRAYERLSLLLERTEPEAMLMDLKNKEPQALNTWTIPQMEQYLLQTVRLEFDHNNSQQIYVSEDLWQKITLARDEMGAFVSQMAHRLPNDATTMDYVKTLITAYHTNGDTPNEVALIQLKQEVKQLM